MKWKILAGIVALAVVPAIVYTVMQSQPGQEPPQTVAVAELPKTVDIAEPCSTVGGAGPWRKPTIEGKSTREGET
jgi:hypothetical protein